MPYDFNPKVWWLVLGMNDLTRSQCSEEIVVLGVLRVAEEIKLRKPDAKIVINSLLPMIDYQRIDAKKGEEPPGPKLEDFADFKAEKDGAREGQVIKDAKKEFEKEGGRRRIRFLREKKRGRDIKPEAAMERKRKYLEARDKRLRNRTFRDNEKYRPKRPVSPLLPMIKKKVLPPVWPAVHVINDKLKEFCRKHGSISFFDATPIFTRDEGRGRHSLHSELISPRGHPSEIGFAVWEGQIMRRLHKMLVVDKPEGKTISNQMNEQEPEQPGILQPVLNNSPDIDEEKEGKGVDHVSDGKSAEPPQPGDEAPDRKDTTQEEETNASLNREEDNGQTDDAEEDDEQKEEVEEDDKREDKAKKDDKQEEEMGEEKVQETGGEEDGELDEEAEEVNKIEGEAEEKNEPKEEAEEEEEEEELKEEAEEEEQKEEAEKDDEQEEELKEEAEEEEELKEE